jgi:hypothetical protein
MRGYAEQWPKVGPQKRKHVAKENAMSDIQGSYSAMPGPPPRQSSSAWVWILVLVVVLPLLACAGVCGGMIFFARQSVEQVQEVIREGAKAAEPFRLALERIQADSQVKESLGEPIQEDFPTVFRYNDNMDSGDAEFRYAINGPLGTADVHVQAEKIDGEWWFSTLEVKISDGETIDLADTDIPINLE